MRVFYVIKALQIIVAAVVIFRLLHVTSICEIRQVHSRSGCLGAMKLAIQPLNTGLSASDARVAVRTGLRVRSRRMKEILTNRDLSLEEIREEATVRRRKGLDPSEEPKTDHVAKTDEASKATGAPIATDHTTKGEAASQANTAKSEPVVAKTDNLKVNPSTEEVKKETMAKEDASTGKPLVRDHTEVKGKEEKAVEEKHHSEKPKDAKEIEIKGYHDPNEGNEASAKPTMEKQKVLGKAVTLEAADKVTISTKAPTIRLANTVLNCLETNGPDILGFGDIDLSHSVALRLPVACLILSIVGFAASMVHTFTNLSRPRRCRIFIENVAQIVMWSVCGFALLLIRQDWETTWNHASAGTFEPIYPTAWRCSEFTCYAMIVVLLLETYFFDYSFYKIYFEESLGNYTVVDRPDYGNSIYGPTVETTEDIAL
ncbi:hypothetical protein ANCCAN_03614 [Ancylostoma caninum]|uniref:Uncharacterized protein n=1 Tax=Ancylostoma caninum TaxID=29170 RepID=A0A368H3P5_ANCCA|nr:hypothetical protein ANCCAN_03614 [Ancylostoma caninum]